MMVAMKKHEKTNFLEFVEASLRDIIWVQDQGPLNSAALRPDEGQFEALMTANLFMMQAEMETRLCPI